MAKKTIHITSQRLLQAMQFCVANQVRGVITVAGWCDSIGFSATNMSNIKKGIQRFSTDHIMTACNTYGISADFIYGFSDEILREDVKSDPLQRIKDAVRELEQAKKNPKTIELKIKKKVV